MFAVIDLGSNSFHLLVADYVEGHFSVIDRHSERVQLAEKIFQTGILQESAMDRGVACLQRFKTALSHHNFERLAVVATQAMRQAKNANVFKTKAKAVGFDIDIISGAKEATLIYRGICDPLPDADFNRLIIDIGGASTEVALGCDLNVLVAESKAIGCVSWRDQFFPGNFDYQTQAPAAKLAAMEGFAGIKSEVENQSWQECYASSGTAKMLCKIAAANNISKGKIHLKHLQEIEELLLPYENSEDIDIAGLKPERRDLLAPGLCIMTALMQTLGIDNFDYSSTALREGVLHEISCHRIDYHLEE